MPRSPTSPSVRLNALRALKPRLAKLRRGETLSAIPMAEMIGVRWPTLRGWVREFDGFEQSGAAVLGSNGVEYVFDPKTTVRFLIGHFEREIAGAAQKAKRVRRLVAGTALADVPDDFSMADIRTMLQTSMLFQEQKERQGALVDAEMVRSKVRVMCSAMQAAGLRAVQEHDPNGRWPIETRTAVEDVARSILLAQERAALECLKDLHEPAAQPGEPRTRGRGPRGGPVPPRPGRAAGRRGLATPPA